MRSALRVRHSLLLALVLALVGLSGCVQVPTTGQVERVPGQAEACQNCINVEVAPPQAGAEPRAIVEGYLRATSNYQPSYSTARQFLTTMAADGLHPEDGASIYRKGTLKPIGDGSTIRLEGHLIGQIEPDRTYAAANRALSHDFKLVQENGEWRISNPPIGLMVAETYFTQFYSAYSIYYVVNKASLVPERIYLPSLRNPANVASALMTALLEGPSTWLEPAAGSAIPPETTLNVASVTINNGIAEVPLSEAVMTLADPERSMMAAQIVYTLRQVAGIKGVLITVNSQKFKVLEADPTSLVIPLDAFARDLSLDPVPLVTDRSYAVRRNGLVYVVTNPNETPNLVEMAGSLGQGKGSEIDSLAVSVDGADVAAVTGQRSALQRASTDTGAVETLKTGLTSMLRPQFTRFGELWTIGVRDGEQRFWRSSPDQPAQSADVDAPVLDGRDITAFRISPDGARIALVQRMPNGEYELGLAAITRARRVTVDGWRPVDLTQDGFTQVRRITDVAWLDANDLLVLGGGTLKAGPVPVRVAADASRISVEGGDPAWGAAQLAVLARPQTAVVVGSEGRTFRDSGSDWAPFLDDIRTIAYPG